MRKRVLFPFTALIVGHLAGCALVNHTMTISYPIPTKGEADSPSFSVVWQPLELRPTHHTEPEAVGVKKNGYGTETAYMFTDPHPQIWLTNAFEAELKHIGIELTQENQEATPRVLVQANHFFIEPDVGFWGSDLTGVTILDVKVTFPQLGKVYERRFVGQETTFEMAWSDADFDRNLIMSAMRAVREAAAEIYNLINEVRGEKVNRVNLSS